MSEKISTMILNRIVSVRDKGFFHLVTANFLAQLFSFATSLIITRFLHPAQLGDVKVLQSYIVLFLVFSGSGFNAAALKYCSENRSQQSKASLLRFSFYGSLATTGLTLVVLILLAASGLLTGTPQLAIWLVLYGLAIPFLTLTDLMVVYLQASKRIREMSRVQAINKAINFFLVSLCTWRWGLAGFIYGTLAASILGVILPLIKVGWRFLKSVPEEIPAGAYSLVLFSVLSAGITTLGQYGDIFILDHFVADRASIGYYSLATYFVIAATQVTMTIQAILSPYFSEHWNDRTWFVRNLRKNQAATIGISVLIALGIYAVAFILIRFFYGPTYQPTLNFLLVLALRYVIFSSYAIIVVSLNGLGLVRFNFYAGVVAVPVGLFLGYLLQFHYGALGVAWAQVMANLLMLIIEIFFLQLVGKVHFDRLRGAVSQTMVK